MTFLGTTEDIPAATVCLKNQQALAGRGARTVVGALMTFCGGVGAAEAFPAPLEGYENRRFPLFIWSIILDEVTGGVLDICDRPQPLPATGGLLGEACGPDCLCTIGGCTR